MKKIPYIALFVIVQMSPEILGRSFLSHPYQTCGRQFITNCRPLFTMWFDLKRNFLNHLNIVIADFVLSSMAFLYVIGDPRRFLREDSGAGRFLPGPCSAGQCTRIRIPAGKRGAMLSSASAAQQTSGLGPPGSPGYIRIPRDAKVT